MSDWNGCKSWRSMKQVREVIAALSPVALSHGYTIMLYGSVLTNGRGHDLDLCLVPWIYTQGPRQLLIVDGPEMMKQMTAAVGGQDVRTADNGEHFYKRYRTRINLDGSVFGLILLPTNQMIDVKIFPRLAHGEDAFDREKYDRATVKEVFGGEDETP